jgi:hypothetical protein
MVNTRKGGGVDQLGSGSAHQLTRGEKARATRERNKKKGEEAAAKARERAAATAAVTAEEGEEEDTSKEMRQIRHNLRCTRCNKKGHLDVDGQYGCFNRPGNEKYRDAAFKGKRYRGNDSDGESVEKKRKVEKHDFTQNIVIEQTYGPDLDE